MAIYRPKCRGEKPDDADYLHREMTNSVFKHVAGGFVGALVALFANLSCAATLNQNLGSALELPQSVVSDTAEGRAAPERTSSVRTAETRKPLPGVGPVEPPATAAEIVGRMLAPGASNPDVPLPHPDLSEKFSDRAEVQGALKGPTPYGRGETGGGVLGLRIPIPVDRGAVTGATTSSPVSSRSESSAERASRP